MNGFVIHEQQYYLFCIVSCNALEGNPPLLDERIVNELQVLRDTPHLSQEMYKPIYLFCSCFF